jgi:hypothetical protein
LAVHSLSAIHSNIFSTVETISVKFNCGGAIFAVNGGNLSRDLSMLQESSQGWCSVSAFAPIHSVHFYDNNKALIDRLCGIVSTGLKTGNAILIVATQDHRDQLVDALEQYGLNMEEHTREERFILRDAQEMLSRFMVGGSPDPDLFLATVGELLAGTKNTARRKDQGLVVFGEMVALLWDEGNQSGSLALEALWNDLLNEKAFHMHCAYPRALFSQDEAGMINICEGHSHVVGTFARPN